ncbi:MAG: DUF6029 family protein [Flavobacteriia bacterium]|jgi:hypothetical protein
MRKLTLGLALAVSTCGFGQLGQGNLTGNIESTFQYLVEDSVIGASQPDQKGLLNSYMNVFYTNGNFRAGLRFESYLPRIQGYPTNFNGTGIGMRYVGYANDFIDITFGSIYEQFGTGLTLRAYEDRALGYDNMLDGARIIVRPKKGFVIKGVYGYQRESFDEGRIIHSPGIVRGFDGEIHLNETFGKLMAESKLDVTIGGSFVSKFEEDDNSVLTLPENVGCYGGRLKLKYGKFAFDAEYVLKEQDPSRDNDTIFNYGHAAVANLSYTQKGLGILLSAKSSDNMSFRSNRSQVLQTSLINYLPALTKTHTYNLVASLYPYPTQLVGEMAYQAEVLYTFKKGSLIGGKYGTSVNANFSTAYRPMRHTSGINPLDSTGVAYSTGLFDMSDSLYWQDINFNISKKFSKNFNVIVSYFNIQLNNDVATVTKETGIIKSNIFVLETGYKFKNKSSLRAELQALIVNRRDSLGNELRLGQGGTPVDKGDWATVVIEYTINSNWFVSVMDQYNFGNPDKQHREHHPYLTAGYIRGATRITASYGRQRAGLFCVGGVCRPVPSSNGLTLSFTHSF